MKSSGLLAALLLACGLAAPAMAQTVRAYEGNGATVAPNGMTAPMPIVVRDGGGTPRSGVTVTFEPACISQTRGELPPFPCVTTAGPLSVVTNASGIAMSPVYQANGTVGNAFVRVSAEFNGQVYRTTIFWKIGAAPSPIDVVTTGTQVVQVNFPMPRALAARIVDHRGQGVDGVPVEFTSHCASNVPCVTAAAVDPRLVSDTSGYVRSGVRTANGVAGNYVVSMAIVGSGNLVDATTATQVAFAMTNVAPVRSRTLQSPLGLGSVYLEMIEAPPTCSLSTMEHLQDDQVPRPPALLAAPRGRIRIVVDNCPHGGKIRFSLQHADAMPEGNRVWTTRPEWKPLDSTNPLEGFWEFEVTDGSAADEDGAADGHFEAVVAVAYGDPAAPNFQDLWWVGPLENGWGVSIVQHGLSLFVVVFAYDASGQPTWYVMPGGSWNATAGYTGNLYSPRGRPINQHTTANLVVGAPVGSATLEFLDVMHARLILRIGGVETVKFIQRQMFGVREARVLPSLADMWWAGSGRSGWGLVLQQQRASLFGLLFSYRADGMPTWYALPQGLWTSNDTYEGLAYRTRSSAWPAAYDPSKFTSTSVGAFRLRFTNGNVNAMFDFAAEGASNLTLERQPF